MRRALLLASVLGLCACILTPRDLEPPPAPPANWDMIPAVFERRSYVDRCGKGQMEKREACIQAFELAMRKRTNR